MGGTNLELAKAVVEAAGKDCRVTIAGGVTTAEEIRALDEIGADAQVGMALYTGRLDLADAIMAPLVTDRPDGLYPTVVVDERGVCLGLVYSSQESIREAVRRRMGIYQSRSPRPVGQGRDQRRHPGAAAHRPRLRPRRPALRRAPDRPRLLPPRHPHLLGRGRRPRAAGPHAGRSAAQQAPAGSYTAKLFADPALLGAKLREEAAELAEAGDREHVIWEAADVLYFTLARLAREGIDLAEVEAHLDRRALEGDPARMTGWTAASAGPASSAPMLERRILVALVVLAAGIWGFSGSPTRCARASRSASIARSCCCSATRPIRAIRWGRSGSNSAVRDITALGGVTVTTIMTLGAAGFLLLSRQAGGGAVRARLDRRRRPAQLRASRPGIERPRPDLLPHGVAGLHGELPERPCHRCRRHLPDSGRAARPVPARAAG